MSNQPVAFEARQVARLSVFKDFAFLGDEAVAEYAAAIRSYPDPDAVEQAITDVIRTWRAEQGSMPAVGDILAQARTVSIERHARGWNQPKCSGCGDSRFVRLLLLRSVTRHPNGEVKHADSQRLTPSQYCDLSERFRVLEKRQAAQGVPAEKRHSYRQQLHTAVQACPDCAGGKPLTPVVMNMEFDFEQN